MRPNDVVAIYNDLMSIGVPIWIDGGWAVDALLGEQTRPHADLDIALELRHLAQSVAYLSDKGYGRWIGMTIDPGTSSLATNTAMRSTST
jgi:lincosamide nucleotidyltransferase A/C/D/E